MEYTSHHPTDNVHDRNVHDRHFHRHTRLSRRGSKFVLSITAYLLYLAFVLVEYLLAAQNKNPLSPRKQKTLSDIPNDPGTIINQFRLNNDHTIYAVCPKRKRHCTYKPILSHGSSAPEYPMPCTFREFEGDSMCGTRLTRPRTIGNVQIQIQSRPCSPPVLGSIWRSSSLVACMDASWTIVSNDGDA